jgi:hypothetical protein
MDERIIKVHEIARDGLPSRSDFPTGRVAFIFDGCIVSGWPLYADPDDDTSSYAGLWGANDDVGLNVKFADVTHWVEFDAPLWEIAADD